MEVHRLAICYTLTKSISTVLILPITGSTGIGVGDSFQKYCQQHWYFLTLK